MSVSKAISGGTGFRCSRVVDTPLPNGAAADGEFGGHRLGGGPETGEGSERGGP